MLRVLPWIVFGLIIHLGYISGQSFVTRDRSPSRSSFRRLPRVGSFGISSETRPNSDLRRSDINSALRLRNREPALTRADLTRLSRDNFAQSNSRGSHIPGTVSRDVGISTRTRGSSRFDTISRLPVRDNLLPETRRPQSGLSASRFSNNNIISGVSDQTLSRARVSRADLINDVNRLLQLLGRDGIDARSSQSSGGALDPLRPRTAISRSVGRTSGIDFNADPDPRTHSPVGTNIVLLRGENSRKPLNLQIGNTQLEVFGNSNPNDAAQLVIQTQRDNAFNIGGGNPPLQSNIPPVRTLPVGTNNVITNQLPVFNQPAALVRSAPVVTQPIKNISAPAKIAAAPTISVLPGNVKAATSLVSGNILPTTPAPVIVQAPVLNVPKSPTQALKEVLGPNVPASLVSKMAMEILPQEIHHLDSLLGNDPNAAILRVGGQTSPFNIGTSKRISFSNIGNGTKATITSVNHPMGGFSHFRGVTEEPEIEELLLKAVLKKMKG